MSRPKLNKIIFFLINYRTGIQNLEAFHRHFTILNSKKMKYIFLFFRFEIQFGILLYSHAMEKSKFYTFLFQHEARMQSLCLFCKITFQIRLYKIYGMHDEKSSFSPFSLLCFFFRFRFFYSSLWMILNMEMEIIKVGLFQHFSFADSDFPLLFLSHKRKT